ncbi:hypothetical protein P875_00053402 [Aspergillus parasiticus SU-1]|uniref:Uncharacterized protein n=3 Tax=Aspergillus subgen. Circumdati TaxID=2720871 RepID=A0A0F0HY62_ASPPU|nr:hypothetical protein P875_00053402 [Aspergillus parasiticus SU-1]
MTDAATAAAFSLAAHGLSMWEQDRPVTFSDRVVSRCSPGAAGTNAGHPRSLFSFEPGGLRLAADVSTKSVCSGGSEAVAETMPSSTAVPSLSSDAASASSSSAGVSLETRWAEGLAGHEILEDDGTGALVVPPPRPARQYHHHTYICLFYILDCHHTFDDVEQWKTHVLSHFRTHEPPRTARCPLCPGERFSDTPDQKGWDRMLDHVDVAHYQRGQTLAGSRPDFELMQYLYRLRIISVDQFKVMQLPPPPSSPAYHRSQEPVRANIGSSDEPYCAPYSRRREQRMRGQRRGVSVG